MKKQLAILALTGSLALGVSAAQASFLELGAYAPSGSGQGTYVDYTTISPDADTAFISSGDKLLAGALYGPNELLIGGQYSGGKDWTDFGLSDFAGKGAIVMATVADGSRNAVGVSITLNGLNPFLKLDTFDLYPNSHYPINQQRDFFFFDIGNFSKSGTVENFADESGSHAGEVKELTVEVVGLETVHFDLMALVTKEQGGAHNTTIDTFWDVNANSKDVTWNGGETPVPEPATMLLLGTGLAGLAGIRRKKKA